MECSELSLFLDQLSSLSSMTIHDKVKKYFLSEDRLKIFTGCTWEQVEAITQMLSSLRNSINRDPLQAVVIFLMKLRTGNSDELINAILEVKDQKL